MEKFVTPDVIVGCITKLAFRDSGLATQQQQEFANKPNWLMNQLIAYYRNLAGMPIDTPCDRRVVIYTKDPIEVVERVAKLAISLSDLTEEQKTEIAKDDEGLKERLVVFFRQHAGLLVDRFLNKEAGWL